MAERVRGVLAKQANTVEKRMFGGLCFMAAGHMCLRGGGRRLDGTGRAGGASHTVAATEEPEV